MRRQPGRWSYDDGACNRNHGNHQDDERERTHQVDQIVQKQIQLFVVVQLMARCNKQQYAQNRTEDNGKVVDRPTIIKVSPKAWIISPFMLTMVATALSNVKSAILVLSNQLLPDFGLGMDLVAVYFNDFQQTAFVQEGQRGRIGGG